MYAMRSRTFSIITLSVILRNSLKEKPFMRIPPYAERFSAVAHRFVSASVVAFGIRKGNPKGIKTWEDLTKPGVEVLYPNPKTSGGAMWDIIAIYGAGLKLADAKQGAPEAQAAGLIKRIQKNVKVMDKSGRESV